MRRAVEDIEVTVIGNADKAFAAVFGQQHRAEHGAAAPREEQLLSTGAGVQNMLNAAYALDIGAIWRTGDVAYNRKIAAGLGLKDNEEIVGFVYLGRVNTTPKPVPELAISDFVQSWPIKSS